MTQSALPPHAGSQSFDLAPLTWVLPDLRKSLPLAVSSARQFFLATKEGDAGLTGAVSLGNLQDARRLYHQARSALEMIGLNVAAKLLIASSNTVKRFSETPAACTEDAVLALEKAQLAILEYLDALLKGRRAPVVGLFPQYRVLLEVLDAPRIHPSDLWIQDWHWREVPLPHGQPVVEMTPRLKAQLGQALLKLLNTGDSAAAAGLKDACISLAAAAASGQTQSFWSLSAGFFEACQHGLIALDMYAKRTASQILQQLNAGLQDAATVSETVAQDAVFFCLRANTEGLNQIAYLAAVQSAYAALERPTIDYHQIQYGRFDPVQMDFLRRRLTALSESWSALAGGDMSRTQAALEHLAAVGETLQKLSPESAMLVTALRRAVDMTIKPGAKPNTLVAMEVATTLLYLEAVYDDMDPAADALGERIDLLVRRLTQVSEGETPAAVEPWMEALYRRLSERQSMGSVTSELRVTLAAVENALEKYLRDPLDSSILAMVSGHLSQMYGVFSVLGLQQAANAVFKIREILDSHLSVEKRKRPIPLNVYEQIARSVSTMGFLIDMLNYQIAIAKEMFVYDAQAGEFSYLNGRGAASKKIVLPSAPNLGPSRPVVAKSSVPSAPPEPTLARQAAPANPIALTAQGPTALQEDEDDGGEILDIFLDEATSVVEDAQRALPPLGSDPEAFDELLLIRRAFHTLKGGARMVGLDAFGESAWAFEQLMNQWMAEQKIPTPELLGLLRQALAAFSHWSQAIQRGQSTSWTEAQFRASADAMRMESRFLPLAQADADALVSTTAQAMQQLQDQSAPNLFAWADTDGSEATLSSAPPTAGDVLPKQVETTSSPWQEPDEADRVDTEEGTSHSVDFAFFKDLAAPIALEAAAAEQTSASGFPEAFFELFISETSEWAERLLVCVSDWAGDGTESDLRTVQDLAHSIRGNSAAVGVQAIAELAQAIEHAIDHLQGSKQAVVPHIVLFQEAASALLAMVQSCAADRVVQASPALVSRLSAVQAADDLGAPSLDALLLGMPDENSSAEPGFELPFANEEVSLAPTRTATAAVTATLRPETPTAPVVLLDESDDPLDSQDQLDADLLPVFQEEGAELMPALGTALRQWVEHPGEAAHRIHVLRILHTLKGSGRLTGAFRLGELAHRIESGIEQLPSLGLSRIQLEPFLGRFDRLQGIFEGLGQYAGADQDASPAGPLSAKNSTPDAPLEFGGANSQTPRPQPAVLTGLIRVRTAVVERLVDQAGEVAVYRSRTETHLAQMGGALGDLSQTLDRLSLQLRELELQADMRIQSRNTTASDAVEQFDPLEFDRFTRLQEIARMMAEAVGDVSTVRRNVQTALSASQQDLEQQSRQLRELQRDLLRMRLVDFEVIADRLYSVVRQAAKELGKQVSLDLEGGKIELDRSVLERMTPSFEHLLRNAVVHGIESAQERSAAGKPAAGAIKVVVSQEGNDVAIRVSDDGKGLSLDQIRRKAQSLGLIAPGQELDRDAITRLLFTQGFSTASQITELAGRGIGLDVVLSEVNALGGRIETHSEENQGTSFKLVLPLTTAVTQVLIFRVGAARFGIPAGLVETVIRASPKMLEAAYADGELTSEQGPVISFYGAGPLLQIKQDAADLKAKSLSVLILRSAGQGLALHVDEVLGNREVVVKNMGPQLSRLPGLAGITVLPSGETILIYNPIALANVYGDAVRKAQTAGALSLAATPGPLEAQAPLILVVDDALTVRRVIQRLLVREGYRVVLANDGVHALQVLELQRPLMVLSDIEMPRMDGFELARSIRARPDTADLPIVMITSRIAQKHRDHAMSLGVNHYLGKPYSESELLGLIHEQVKAAAVVSL